MKALFVSRHNNDYDSMAPVAHGWVAGDPANAATFLFASAEMAWRDDYRTRELEAGGRIDFTDFWQVAATGGAGDALYRAWRTVTPERQIRRALLQPLTEMAVAPRLARRLDAFLDRLLPDIVAFDWYPVPARRERFGLFGYQRILGHARRRKVPVVALPHGLVLYDQPQAKAARLGAYDAMFVESEHRRTILQALGGDLPPIVVSGSPRYDPDWVERMVSRLARSFPAAAPRPPDRIGVVYFGKKQVYEFDFEAQNRWLAELAAHPRVDLVIQPHPRGQKDRAFAALAGLPNVAIDALTPASVLIERSDLVSTLTSSVIAEAVVRGREILYPKFVNTVTTRFEERGACIAIGGPGETAAAIDSYAAGRRVPRENYLRFLEDSVWGFPDGATIDRVCAEMAAMAAGAAASGAGAA